MTIDTEPIRESIAHAIAMRRKYRTTDKELWKLWKQEVHRLNSDLLTAERINAAHQ